MPTVEEAVRRPPSSSVTCQSARPARRLPTFGGWAWPGVSVALDSDDRPARRACNPIDDKRGAIEYRTKVAGPMVGQTVAIAYERAGER
jgi:hypothetical protein